MKNRYGVGFHVLCLIVLFFAINLVGQTAPTHSILLYSNDLYQANAGSGARFTNRSGRFIDGKGWETSSNTAQLVIELDEPIPFEGTIEFDVLNLDPPNQVTDDVVLWSLYSRPEASFDAVDTSLASYVLFKTDRHRLDGDQAAFNFFSASYRGSQNRTKGKSVAKRVWNPAHSYHFKIVFNTVNLWLFIDGELIEVHPFYGQIEKFKYLLFGRDNTYYLSAPGPIFSHLKIYGPETALPFTDITVETKTGGYSDVGYGHGVSFADVNNDGLIDLFSSNAVRALVVPDKLYINQGDGTFRDEAPDRGVDDLGVTHAILSADFDNDGDADVFHSNMPIDAGSPLGRNAIYRNDGKGYFTDMTESAGIVDENNASRGAVALDIENDGDFDIYVANWGEANELYVNQGNWKFTREDRGTKGVAVDPGVLGQQGLSAVDFDNDGDTDIYVCRRQEAATPAPNWLLVNDGSGNFTEEAAARGVDYGGRSNGASFADIDNDGDLDLIVVNNATADKQLELLHVAINNGDGTFTDRSNEYNIRVAGFNAVFADIDNDADLDMYLVKNDIDDPSARPEIYLNDGKGNFTIQGYSEARVPTKDPRGVGVADIDLDGDVDFYLAAKFSHNFMVRNDIVNDNNFIRLLPIGPNGDYGGFGTKVTIYEPGHLGEPDRIIGYQHAQSTYGYLCQNEPTLHFGLAGLSACDIRLEFTSGIVRNLVGVAANQTLTVPAVVPEPTRLEALSLSTQQGFAGKQLPEPVQIRVLDDQDAPFPNHPVRFELTSDGFIEDHLRQTEVLTNELGIASVHWTLGETAGLLNRLVVTSLFESAPLIGSPLELTVLSVAGPDTLLSIRSGNNQEGFTDAELVEPLVVFVGDSLNNPHQNVAVKFSTEPGNGLVNGESSAIVYSDEQGLAFVRWSLGSITDQSQMATASLVSDPQNSVRFYAENNFGTPSELIYVAGDSCLGVVSQQLPCPLIVKVVNEQNIGLANYLVTFKGQSGKIHFNGSPEIQVRTNEEGFASVSPDLGGTPGDFIVDAVATSAGGTPLEGSPVEFVVRARKSLATTLTLLSPDTISGQTDNLALDSVRVKITGATGQAVPGHPVTFVRTRGSGGFGPERLDSLTLISGNNGIAQVAYRFGGTIGEENVIQIRSNDGVDELEGSPTRVIAIAQYGQPSPSMSEITVPAQADAGRERVPVVVTLRDSNLNPVAGELVVIQALAERVVVEQPKAPTDQEGVVTGYVSTSRAGVVSISAIIVDSGEAVEQTGSINFVAGPAHILDILSGNGQTGNVNSVLAEPLTVQLFDKFRNEKANERVEFKVVSGGGTSLPAGPVFTDSTGKASTRWKLGPISGSQTMAATANNNSASIHFQALAQAPGELLLTKVKGDNQFASPNSLFGDSLVVKVTDAERNPVSGIVVSFAVMSGDVIIENFQAESDLFGRAGIVLRAGSNLGTAVIRAGIELRAFVEFSCTVAGSIPAKVVAPQTTTLSTTVGQEVPVAIQLLDSQDQPAGGVDVRFESNSEGLLFLEGNVVRTDTAGVASNRVRVGTQVGRYTFVASPSGLATQSVEFILDAHAGDPAGLVIVDGNDQTGMPGALLEKPLLLKVLDSFGNPVPGVTVRFQIEAGGGQILYPGGNSSDANGLVSAQWRLGASGQQLATAYCESFPDIKTVLTASLLANKPPVLTIPADTTITEQQSLSFHVNAYDEDGSISSITVQGLPSGAQYDAVGNNFYWTPGFDQSGTVVLTFKAMDNNDATTIAKMTITVLDKNRPPAIMSFNPQVNDIYVEPFQAIRLNVQTIDLDNDRLTIRWSLNNTEIARGRQCTFIINPELPPLSKMRVLVSDDHDSTSHMWFIHILNTKVELTAFSATAKDGVALVQWQVKSQGNTRGFNLYRSHRPEGDFVKVNKKMIEFTENGTYLYRDCLESVVGTVYYKLEEITTQGQTHQFAPLSLDIALPEENRLFQNYPNPFNPATNIKFKLKESSEITVSIYNLNGQVVDIIYQGRLPAGYYVKRWNGTGLSGEPVTSGLYYCVLRSKEFHQSIKLLYLK